VSVKWTCPNDPSANVHALRRNDHKLFKRTHRTVVVKTFLDNGRQWALDRPKVLEDEPTDEPTCETCGAVAIQETVEE
jgi:hypothetical protein